MASNSNTGRAITEHRIDLGAQVGMARNAAFASGGRTHKLTELAYYAPRPNYDSPRMTIRDVSEEVIQK